MKKFIKKSLIWYVITFVGSMAILTFSGMKDLTELKDHMPILMFGAFIGVMCAYHPFRESFK